MIKVEKVDGANFRAVNDIFTDIWGAGSEDKERKIFDLMI